VWVPKLVRTAELRLCPSGGHGVMDLRSCAIHPNHPVADALGTSRTPCDGEPRDRTVSHVFTAFAAVASSGLRRAQGGRAARDESDHVPSALHGPRSRHAKRLLRTPGRVFGIPQAYAALHSLPCSILVSKVRSTADPRPNQSGILDRVTFLVTRPADGDPVPVAACTLDVASH
jgi:hypothetical protein